MTKLTTITSLIISSFVFSQVGINNSNPIATLDVNGNVKISDIKEVDLENIKYLLTVNDDQIVKKTNKNVSSGVEATNNRAYAVLNQKDPVKLETIKISQNVTFNGVLSGINSSNIQIDPTKKHLNFPPNKAYKVTGMIGLRGYRSDGLGSGRPGYVTSQFFLREGSPIISTIGYTESSNEAYDDGGTTQPIIIFNTGSTGASLYLSARYGGQSAGTDGFFLAGETNNNSVGTYIIIEEL